MPNWLKDAVFYEIYPSSFYDSNGDGIGDIQGIIQKLDYVKDLGCNAIWLNPCFDSPFLDGGYDIKDYKKVAPRYGTNEDLINLFIQAHQKGIKILLDLVPGHTSDQHPWFLASKENNTNEYAGRYVWTSNAFEGIANRPYISGMSQRAGAYMLNFFASQPALNYGWGKVTEKWQDSYDSPNAVSTREALKDIMRYWLDLGCDGYRVDMADSLIKEDDDKKLTSALWKEIREMLEKDYPEAVLVSELSNPRQAINHGGFHMDFYLDHWHNGYNTLLRDYEPNEIDNSYFLASADRDINRFLDDYLPKYNETKENGFISFMTCNHDTPRPARTLSQDELKIAYAFLFTMPGVPFLYYGDEIGMDYLDVENKEGGYHRTGSRTPMQWSNEKNLGFSSAEEKDIYLPIDKRDTAPTVQDQLNDKDSLLNTVKDIIHLRHINDDLKADASFEVVIRDKEKPFVYKRGNILAVVNPSLKDKTVDINIDIVEKPMYEIGHTYKKENSITISKQSFALFKIINHA